MVCQVHDIHSYFWTVSSAVHLLCMLTYMNLNTLLPNNTIWVRFGSVWFTLVRQS